MHQQGEFADANKQNQPRVSKHLQQSIITVPQIDLWLETCFVDITPTNQTNELSQIHARSISVVNKYKT
jgi:hypothetical protein